MKTFVCILLCCIFMTNCKAQDPEFKTYLSNFGESRTPILIDDSQPISDFIFFQAYDSLLGLKTYKIIPQKFVEKFICADNFCNSNAGYFRYDYGIKVDFNKAYTTVLVRKFQDEGQPEWSFDLYETLLITYNRKGEILSRLSLTKDNDRWKSSLEITKEGITVKQIKVIEPKIDQYHRDLHCEYWTTTYQITNDGIIKTITTSPIANGLVIWDKNVEDYKLKQ